MEYTLGQMVADAEWVLEGLCNDITDALDRLHPRISEQPLSRLVTVQAHSALRAALPEISATKRVLADQFEQDPDTETQGLIALAEKLEAFIPRLTDPPACDPAPVPVPVAVPVAAVEPAPAPAAASAEPVKQSVPAPAGGFGALPASPGSRPEQLTFVQWDDWTGVYLHGQLIYEGHSVSGKDLAEALGMTVLDEEPPSEEFAFRHGALPARLEDLPASR